MDSTLKELRDFADTALEIKKAGRSLNDIQAACTAGSLLLLQCREQSRLSALEADRIREETATQRAALDTASLQLHNLVYEQQYYDKEIASCRTFQPGVPDDKLQCISTQDFLSLPEQAAALAGKSSHEMELARLNYELQERKQLKARLQQLQQHKQRAQADLSAAAGRIDDLRTHMEALIHSSRPLMETSLPDTSAIKANKEAAELLPLPLYIIYSQAVTSSSVVGLPLKVEIEGSTAAAATLAAAAQQDNNAAAAAAPVTAAATEAAQAKRRRKSEAQDDQTYKVHPLSVAIDVQAASQGNSGEPVMQLTFKYYTQLKLVGVSASSAGDEDILTDLFVGDPGDGQLLENVAAACSTGVHQFGAPDRPRPFRWAQDLAGVDVVYSLPSSFTIADRKEQVLAALSAYRSQLRLEAFVERLTAAKQGRLALNAILEKLSNVSNKQLPHSSWDSKVLAKVDAFVYSFKQVGDAGVATKQLDQQQLQRSAFPVAAQQAMQVWQPMAASAAEEGEVAGAADGMETTSRLVHRDTTDEDLLQGLLVEEAAGPAAGEAAAMAGGAAAGAGPAVGGNAADELMLDEGALIDYELAYDQGEYQEHSEGEASAASDEDAAKADAASAAEEASSSAAQRLQARHCLYRLVLRSGPLEVHFHVKVFLNYPLFPPVFAVTKLLDTSKGSKGEKGAQLTAVNEVLRLEQQANSLAVQAARAHPDEVLAVQVKQVCQVLDLLAGQVRAKDHVDRLRAKQQLRGKERQARLMWGDYK